MPRIKVDDVELFYEEAGTGTPLLFIHEFAGDYRSWEPQLRFFSSRYRCISYSQRGYPPSAVPESLEAYSQDRMIADAVGLLDGLNIPKAHICGLSMGGFTTLLFGLKHPERALSLVIAGAGYGSGSTRAEFQEVMGGVADNFRNNSTAVVAETYTVGPARVQFRNKNPRAFAEFQRQFLERSNIGMANMLNGVQQQRPDIMTLGAEMAASPLPALILIGDEDMAGLEASLYMKRQFPRAGMEMFPRSGHVINLEEPERFNRSVLEFLTCVEVGKWHPRDPAALTALV